MGLTAIRLALSFIVLLPSLPPAFAFQGARFPAPEDFALEIHCSPGHPRYLDIPGTEITPIAIYEFARIKNWQRPATQSEDASAIQIRCHREGDVLKIETSVLLGQVDEYRTLPAGGITSALPLASYSASLGQSITLQELAGVGIEPFDVKVVRSESHTIDPAEIENRTSACSVVRFERARSQYRITFKNTSSKKIIGLRLLYGSGEARFDQLVSLPGVGLRHFDTAIESGQPFEAWLSIELPTDPKFMLAGVAFEDLTVDGAIETVLFIAASRRGRKIQFSRIVGLVKAALENPQPDDRKTLETLRQQVSMLSEGAERSVVDDLGRRFAPLTPSQANVLIGHLNRILQAEKEWFLTRLRYYEKQEAAQGKSFQSWLRETKKAYEAMLANQQ